jgi:uncharacterized LabA/DUF88 family protein
LRRTPPVASVAGREAACGRSLLFKHAMRINVYIDGFNLYHGGVQGTPYRWLDLGKLCRQVLPGHSVNRIRYCTALVQRPARQLVYIRALETIPGLTVHYGQFRTHVVSARLANSPPGGALRTDVIRTEEKGSDVNLATLLLCDAFDRDFEMAAVVSADSDLAMPIEVVRKKFGLDVVVLHPPRRHSTELRKIATSYRPIRDRAIRACQFPLILTDQHGVITKPATW